jgi:hypothetical protein
MEALVVAIVAAAVGGALSLAGVWLSGREARKAAAEADARLEDREHRARIRDARLEAIDQTRRAFGGMLMEALQQAAGGPALQGRYGADTYPLADIRLVGDVDAARATLDVTSELVSRPRNQAATKDDAAKVAGATRLLNAALDRQAERARNDQPLVDLPIDAEVESSVANATRRLGIAPGEQSGTR